MNIATCNFRITCWLIVLAEDIRDYCYIVFYLEYSDQLRINVAISSNEFTLLNVVFRYCTYATFKELIHNFFCTVSSSTWILQFYKVERNRSIHSSMTRTIFISSYPLKIIFPLKIMKK